MNRVPDQKPRVPSYADCELAMRVGKPTALEQFVYEFEPCGSSSGPLFRMLLAEALAECSRCTTSKH